MESNTSIPVIVDDVKNLENFRMTRVVYFSIGAVDYLSDISIEHGEYGFPVAVLDFHGIITGDRSGNIFNSVKSLNELFDSIEEGEELFVDTNDIWIPNMLCGKEYVRGDVFRIGRKLFKAAMAYRHDKLGYEEYLRISTDLKGHMMDSPIENEVFREWSKSQIEFAKEAYFARDPELNLKYEN